MDRELRSTVGHVAGVDRPAVGLRDRLRDGEPEARARAAGRIVSSPEPPEQLPLGARRKACAVVTDAHDDLAVRALAGDANGRAPRRALHRVVEDGEAAL